MGKRSCKQLCLVIVFFILSVSSMCQSRPLGLRGSTKSVTNGIEMFIDELYIEGIKTGGPSAGGEGHGFGNAETLGDRKVGGPSDGGEGHEFSNAEIHGERKLGGPSAGGRGHGLIDAGILGGQKSGGPSAGGKGHEFNTSQIRGAHPQSGPSPGEGN